MSNNKETDETKSVKPASENEVAGEASKERGFHNLTTLELYGTLAGLMLTLLLAALDQTIVGTAMPRIISELNGFEKYAWVTTAYLLTSTVSVPVFGKLSDIFGRKNIFLAGTIVFVASSALCGAAGDIPLFGLDAMTELIVFRAVQGVGAGIITGLIFTILGDMFTPAERGKYQGFFAAVMGLAAVVGPLLGGFITDNYSWRWVFYVNLPVGIAALLVLFFAFPKVEPSKDVKRTIDWLGVAALVLCLVPVLLAFEAVTDSGWHSPRVIGLLAFGALMLPVFVFIESRAVEPIVPLSLFRNRIISVSFLGVFLLGIGMFCVILYVPLFAQGVLGFSAAASGSLLTPLMLASVATSVGGGQLMSRTGHYKILALAGAAMMAAGLFLLSRTNLETTHTTLVFKLILIGLGIGALQPIYTLVVQNVAPAAALGSATASVQFFRSIGATVGTTVFGSLIIGQYKQNFNRAAPDGINSETLALFADPLQLTASRGGLEQTFASMPDGANLLRLLLGNEQTALLGSITEVFLIAAVLMATAIVVNLFLKEVPLRGKSVPAEQLGTQTVPPLDLEKCRRSPRVLSVKST